MATINVIRSQRGAGKIRDALILAACLRQAGHDVTISVPGQESTLRRWAATASCRLRIRRRYDINLFIEKLWPRILRQAHVNCLIPNQEWLRDDTRARLDSVDVVLCKTRHAVTVFDGLGCKTDFIGFTAEDRFVPEAEKDFNTFLHAPGRSLWKGTDVVVRCWSKHPEWPRLVLIRNDELATGGYVPQANITYINRFLGEDEFRLIQNRCGVHLCPSEMEGFGHYIAEAMSCGCVTLTVNAPPMNELVDRDRGILVDHARSEPHCAGTRFFVDDADFERGIEEYLSLPETHKVDMGRHGRTWFLENDQQFRTRLPAVLRHHLAAR